MGPIIGMREPVGIIPSQSLKATSSSEKMEKQVQTEMLADVRPQLSQPSIANRTVHPGQLVTQVWSPNIGGSKSKNTEAAHRENLLASAHQLDRALNQATEAARPTAPASVLPQASRSTSHHIREKVPIRPALSSPLAKPILSTQVKVKDANTFDAKLKSFFAGKINEFINKIKEYKIQRDLEHIQQNIGKEIKINEEKFAKSKDVNDEAKGERLNLLQATVAKNPVLVRKIIADSHQDPLYQHMGAINFVSYLLISNKNVAEKGGPELKNVHLSDCQRVALYGYTTGDYAEINSALRNAQGGKIKDPSLQAYTQHVIEGMKQLPDYAGGETLYRGLFQKPKKAGIADPLAAEKAWKDENLKINGLYQDHGIASTTTDRDNLQGAYKLMIAGSKNAKDLGPFSAFPGEKEIAFLPGTRFKVDQVGLPPHANLNVWVRLTPIEDS